MLKHMILNGGGCVSKRIKFRKGGSGFGSPLSEAGLGMSKRALKLRIMERECRVFLELKGRWLHGVFLFNKLARCCAAAVQALFAFSGSGKRLYLSRALPAVAYSGK